MLQTKELEHHFYSKIYSGCIWFVYQEGLLLDFEIPYDRTGKVFVNCFVEMMDLCVVFHLCLTGQHINRILFIFNISQFTVKI